MIKEIALMFSGGIDSTMAACLLAEEYDKVHLLTYNNGYGHMFMSATKKRVKELEKKFPGKFSHKLTSSKKLFEDIAVNNIYDEYKKHESGFVWCLGCKIAMHTQSIIYCLENAIPYMSDGSSRDTSEMVEQKPFSIKLIKQMYSSYGIEFITPVYDIKRNEEISKLKTMGFNMGLFRVMDRFIGIQPKCFAGELYYLPNILFKRKPKHDNYQIKIFFNRKRELVERTIEKHFESKGINTKQQIKIIQEKITSGKKDGMLQYKKSE